MTSSDSLNESIKTFGREIFTKLGNEQPSAFNKKYWSGRILEYSMQHPELKLNLFRLVSVLPDLRSSASISRHVSEYLGDVGKSISRVLDWGLNANPTSLRAKLTSLIVKKSVIQMAQDFIAGDTPATALKALRKIRAQGLAFTVDLLGEYSLSEIEAEAYSQRYLKCLDALGAAAEEWGERKPLVLDHPGEKSPILVTVKLSALYSQCSVLNIDRSIDVLSERLAVIARRARDRQALLCVDAEDVANNQIIYEVFTRVFGDQEFRTFPYPGIALQAYAKDSEARLIELLKFAERREAPIAIRLVKGAYWDHETIAANQIGWSSPLYRQKSSSDANFEKLTRILLDHHQLALPAIGSHNIRSLAHACCYARKIGLTQKHFELQMLYGMADPIARAFAKQGYLCRLYVPIGELIPGMGYLVRRLIENTSNESFLRNTFYDSIDVDRLLEEPLLRD